ncbi:ABC transporter substrate-binding protein [Sulfobacillus sp. DSM 109850]|uniref:ABC transporter substrate-binding protein n=2 Tax=Sulfobacillus harzensis TaxID=2729629 RepID=A0A7Y0L614_9FIRM|nr:ABC transporter substrate-binding protein [Sulfobacillus harzensis]
MTVILTFGTGILAGCGTTTSTAARPPALIRITDDLHHTITLTKPATRIVTLEPSNAEIALDLGLKPEIVGTDQTTFQYTPAPWKQQLHGIPNIGPSYPGISVEKIVAAKPNLVIATTGIKGLSSLARFHIPVLVLQPTSVQGIYHDVMLVGRATGKTAQARATVIHMKHQLATIQQVVRRVKTRPTVFYDLGGLYTAGPHTFLNALIDMAGAFNVGARLSTQQYPQVTAEQVVKANPEDILIDPESGTTVSKEEHLAGFSAITAVKTGHVDVIPDSSYVNEPSPALVMGLKELVKMLHPQLKLPTK